MAKKHLVDVRRELFHVGFNSNKHDMAGIVPLVVLKDDTENNLNSNEYLFRDDSDYFKSDNYDSDCSLGSMNSVYLKLNDKSFLDLTKKMNKTSNQNSIKLAKCPKNNLVTKSQKSRVIKMYDKIKDEKPINKLNTYKFYGKQKSIAQYTFSKLFLLRKLKYKCTNSKLLKSKYPTWQYKNYTNKSYFSSKNKQNRKHLMLMKKKMNQENDKLIRNQLKEPIPLLIFSHKAINNELNIKKYSIPNTAGKLKQDEIDFKIDCNSAVKENSLKIQNKSGPNDFIDTDDFMDTTAIENIIKSLFEDD